MRTRKLHQNLDEKLTACPVCGGVDIPTFTFAKVARYQGHLVYSSCQGCGQMFLNPRMSDATTREYYQGAYRTQLWGASGVDEQEMVVQRLRASLHAQAESIWNVIPATVLDIGCSMGYVLWEWNKRGAVCTGIEPEMRHHAIKPASNFKLYTDIAELPPQPFDLISMSHVLEHINHPREYLQHLSETYTHPHTKLMIEVPNTECCTAAYRIHHPLAFTRYTLEKLLEGVGYHLVQHLYHGLSNTSVHRYLLCLFERDHATQEGIE